MSLWVPPLVAILYSALLFALAHAADRGRMTSPAMRDSNWIFGLSLAVYCTSWTFYGAVGTAVSRGWHFLPIYLGPILLFVFGHRIIARVLETGKGQHSTSIADFLSARYGKSAWVAALVTIIALLGSLPYMALQLKSVSQTLIAASPGLTAYLGSEEIAMAVTVAMAVFAVLFGTGRLDLTHHNRGMVIAIAAEAVVKLAALLTVALFALFLLLGRGAAATPLPPLSEQFRAEQLDIRFLVMTMLSAGAVLCLPRQFHMLVVEAPQSRFGGAMRWVFPAYLLITALAVIPVVQAGLHLLPGTASPDMMMLELPLSQGRQWLATFVFIGGFSASTGMIIVATIALSGMIANDLLLPLLFRDQGRLRQGHIALGNALIGVRRISIVVLLGLAYLYYRSIASSATLASLGEMAFAASGQFLPGLLFGLYWRRGNRAGMIAGLLAGFGAWLLLLFLPVYTQTAPLVQIGPDRFISGLLISLSANIICYLLFSLIHEPNLVDRVQAIAFVDRSSPDLGRSGYVTQVRVADLRLLLEQFIGQERARAALNSLRLTSGLRHADSDPAGAALIEICERHLSGILGSSSARALIQSTLEGDPLPIEQVAAMFDETSQRLKFSAGLLQTAIENIDQGVSVIDRDLRLVAWNSRYAEMFGYARELVEVGRPVEDLIRFNMRSLGVAEKEIDAQVARRLARLRAGRRHSTERDLPDGRVLRVLGNPIPTGGYVTSYTDITADRKAELALEAKVSERTEQLVAVNSALEAATRSKTRFLAAASHDLVQPMNAARLFASALAEDLGQDSAHQRDLLDKIDRSIATANRLLRALLDISKLDGGGLKPDIQPVSLGQLIMDAANEFQVQAENKGLSLRTVPSRLWVATDRGLTISVMQNLLTNAVRYSTRGKVLIGARRRGDSAEILVIDQGQGIAPEHLDRIFDEFTRLDSGDRGDGLGLGLAIVRRITGLLGSGIEVRSTPGRGSCFSFRLPVAEPQEAEAPTGTAGGTGRASPLSARRILCIDDDPANLVALRSLLEKWGLEVVTASGPDDDMCRTRPDLLIVDYHLDDGLTGDAAHARLTALWGDAPPTLLLTAEDSGTTTLAAQKMGAVHMLKPPSPARLRAVLTQMLG